VFEEQEDRCGSLRYPLSTQRDAVDFVKLINRKGFPYVLMCTAIDEQQEKFRSWRLGNGHAHIGTAMLKRINSTVQVYSPSPCRRRCRINANRGPWQLFARGPLLTRDKDLSKLYPCERGASNSSRHDMLAIISSRYQYGPFLFFVAEVMSNYLTTDGLKKISLLPEAPLWHEARGICHICHMVNPALAGA